MKKFISLALCVVTLMISIIPASAATTPADFSDNLVVHYDFDGNTLEEKLADKAPAGVSKENLNIFGNAGTEIKDGSAFIAQESGNYLACMFDNTAEKGAGTDIKNFRASDGSVSFTVAVSFKMDVDPAQNNTNKSAKYLMEINNGFGLSVSRPFDGGTKSSVAYVVPNTTFNGTNFGVGAGRKAADVMDSKDRLVINRIDKYTIIVMSVTMKDNAGTYEATISTHMSLDDGKTFFKTGTDRIAATSKDAFLNPTSIAIGKALSGPSQNTITDFEIDDFRIYNNALSQDNAKALIPVIGRGAMFYGYQTTAIEDKKFDVRLVGSIESTDYDAIGFKVKATYAGGTKEWDKCGTVVYQKLIGNVNKNLTEYTPNTVRGNETYIYALTIENIPDNVGSITFEVTPYYAMNGSPVLGETKSFTVNSATLS